jgi:peptidoglycan/xylan/chitin deacetylase (PgdA/CDA1 family)
VSVLCYHSVARGWDDPVSVETTDFAVQCALLQRRERVVPLATVRDSLAAGRGLPRGTSVLTFDDGFADYVEHAVPILERHGLPAVMYIVAGSVTPAGVTVNWIRGLDPADAPPLLTADQIRDLHARGWEFGSHSMAHRDLPLLSEEECLRDLRESREILSDLLGAEVMTLAYPFGRHAPHVRRAAERAGYSIAFALPDGPEEEGPFAIPRTGIYRGNGLWTFRVKTSRSYATVRTSRLYEGLRGAAGAMRARVGGWGRHG